MYSSGSVFDEYVLHFIYRCSYCDSLIITQNRLSTKIDYDGKIDSNHRAVWSRECLKTIINKILEKTNDCNLVPDLLVENSFSSQTTYGLYSGSYSIAGLDCKCPSCQNKNLWQKREFDKLSFDLEKVELPQLIDIQMANRYYAAEYQSTSNSKDYFKKIFEDNNVRRGKLLKEVNNICCHRDRLLTERNDLEEIVINKGLFSKLKAQSQIKKLDEEISKVDEIIEKLKGEVTLFEEVRKSMDADNLDGVVLYPKVYGERLRDKYGHRCGGIVAVSYSTTEEENDLSLVASLLEDRL